MSVDEPVIIASPSLKSQSKIKNSKLNENEILQVGRFVLETESRAIAALSSRINQSFVAACLMLLECKGRVIVTGIGKSGHIARKIAATLASTGTPAFFLHPAEALHGDLGMITAQDVVLALSNSGETEEILKILPLIKRLNVPIITLTGKKESTLSNIADVNLDVAIEQEACSLGLAPTASTTATLAMGDALAISLIEARGFTAEDFAKSHPGGRLGRRLLLKTEDVMRTGDAIPIVPETAILAEAIIEMTQKRLGFTTVVAASDPTQMLGIFTDGDLRRAIERNLDLHHTPIKTIMSKNYKSITIGTLAVEAITIMEKAPKSFVLPVLDKSGKLAGALNMHDILKAGLL